MDCYFNYKSNLLRIKQFSKGAIDFTDYSKIEEHPTGDRQRRILFLNWKCSEIIVPTCFGDRLQTYT